MAVSDFKITDVIPRIQYVAAPGQTDFPIPFRFFEDADIEAYVDSDTPSPSTDYSIVGAGTNSDGTLTFDTPMVGGELVTLARNSAIERVTNFQDSGDWQAQNVNDQLNRLTTYIQEVALKAIDLAVTLPLTSPLSGLDFPAGGPGFENRVIGFGPAGDTLVAGPSFQGLLDYLADAEAARDAAILASNSAQSSEDDAQSFANLANLALTDALAAKAAAEAAAAGMKWRPSVRMATTSALPTVVYNNGSSGVSGTLTASANGALPSIDGVTPQLNDLILVKNQASALQNGVYIVSQLGSGSSPFILTRSSDADTWAELVSQARLIEEGTTLADTFWICTVNQSGTIGTTSVTFSTFSAVPANNSVTNAMLANMVAKTIKARNTGSTGSPEDVTITQLLDFVTGSAAEGDILVRGTSTWDRLAKGLALQYLRRNAANNGFEYANPPVNNIGTAYVQAYRAASANLVAPNDIVFDTETYDQGNNHNNSTGVFVAPAAGLYFFMVTTTNQNTSVVQLQVNGVSIDQYVTYNNAFTITKPHILYLNQNDQVKYRLTAGTMYGSSSIGGIANGLFILRLT